VLVTGASGFLGQATCITLARQGFDVHGIYLHSTPPQLPAVTWHRADLLDIDAVRATVATLRARWLVHLAWIATPGRFWTDPVNIQWLNASTALAQSFVANGGRGVLAAGTCAEYAWDESVCDEGTTPLAPATLYGASKHALRLALGSICGGADVPATWIRLFNLYGPNEHRDRVIASCIVSLLRGENFDCTHGRQERDFLDVRDVADAIGLLVQDLDRRAAVDSSVVSTGNVMETYNVASGRGVRLRDVLELIEQSIPGPGRVRFGARAAPGHEPERLVASIERLRARTGWTPSHDLGSGIGHAIDWWRNRYAAGGPQPQTGASR
jgi:nucleoside-diphosphate-sugar epimerase